MFIHHDAEIQNLISSFICPRKEFESMQSKRVRRQDSRVSNIFVYFSKQKTFCLQKHFKDKFAAYFCKEIQEEIKSQQWSTVKKEYNLRCVNDRFF